MMKIQMQPNKWSCLPTAFAIALGVPVGEVIKTIGHDGSEIVFPGLTEPFCRRSFHIQELIDVCTHRNIGIIPVEIAPISETIRRHTYKIPVLSDRIEYYLIKYTGVLTGIGASGKPHAVAWDGNMVLDPNGGKYNVRDFQIDTFFLIVQFNITK